jgi:hypothetical protein
LPQLQKGTAQRDQICSAACRKKTKVANPNEASGQDMQQKTPQKLVRIERHHSLFITVSIILPTKRDLSVGEGYEPVIRNGNAMSVTS